FLSVILGDQPVLSPASRLYQRVLALDPDESWELVARELDSGTSLVEVCDTMLLPVLCLAQQDHRERGIDDATLSRCAAAVRDLLDEAHERHVESLAKESGGAPVVPLVARPLRVLCIPAGGDADDVACAMLNRVLRLSGCEAAELPH